MCCACVAVALLVTCCLVVFWLDCVLIRLVCHVFVIGLLLFQLCSVCVCCVLMWVAVCCGCCVLMCVMRVDLCVLS